MENFSILLEKLSSVLIYTFLLLMPNLSTTMAPINASINGTNKLVLPLLHHHPRPRFHKPNGFTAPLLNDKRLISLFVNVSIGEPPVYLLLLMDTACPITWVRSPSSCYDERCTADYYNHKASSTYTDISCGHKGECFQYLGYQYSRNCNKESHCTYTVSYADGARSSGIMAIEKFIFLTYQDYSVEIPNLVFGYSLETREPETTDGLLGLHPFNQHSLVSRVGNKFSYCIGNMSDPSYMYSHLVLGEQTNTQGHSTTPMKENEIGRYLVKLEGISIGDTQLKIQPTEYHYTVLIDSGSTFSLISSDSYEQLKSEVMGLLSGVLNPVSTRDRLCYRGNVVRDLRGFPLVSLRFYGGAQIKLDVEALFRMEADDVFCMTVVVSDRRPFIIGLFAQQNYNIGFDFDKMEISFQRIECRWLLIDD